VERKHSRAASGNIRLMADNSSEAALFAPVDHRLPRLIIPMTDCPQGDFVMLLCVGQVFFIKFCYHYFNNLLFQRFSLYCF